MLRTTFKDWYRPTEDELSQIFKDGTIALDTNVLFALYRMGTTTREKILDALVDDAVRSRIFVPHQVGLEYSRRRLQIAKEPHTAFDKIVERVDGLKKLLANTGQHNIRDTEVQKEVREAAAPLLDKLKAEIRRIETEHTIPYTDVEKSDPVLNSLEHILRDSGQLGTAPSPTELEKLIQVAHDRYDQKVPPGYADKVGPKARDNPEGDYLIWHELLTRAASDSSPILFVTEDQTDDWYLKDDDGKTLGPRTELRAEMPVLYHQTTLANFLKFISPHLVTPLADETIQEVERAVARPQRTSRPRLLPPAVTARNNELLKRAFSSVEWKNQLGDSLKLPSDLSERILAQTTIDVGRSIVEHYFDEVMRETDDDDAYDAADHNSQQMLDELRRERDWDAYSASETEEDNGPEDPS